MSIETVYKCDECRHRYERTKLYSYRIESSCIKPVSTAWLPLTRIEVHLCVPCSNNLGITTDAMFKRNGCLHAIVALSEVPTNA